jgi:formiminoglutamate deiminase
MAGESGRAVHCELAWLGGSEPTADVLVELDGDRIATVTPGVARPASALALPGLTLPGLANAHSHAFHRALRGRTQGGVGSFWTWRDQMYAVAERLTPATYHRLARAVFAEMALAGITCVGEFHYLHHGADGQPYDDPNAMGLALVAAARDVGIRITLLDTCYLQGGIGTPPNDVQRRFSDLRVDRWAARVEALLPAVAADVRIGAAIHSVRALDPDAIEAVARWANDRDLPLHAHVSEQVAENHACIEAYALTPTELLHERHALSDRFTAVHATHLTEHDRHLLGTTGATACFCPTTERDLADGIGPAAALVEEGAGLALGSDSHAVVDLFEEARAVELHERLVSNVRGNLTTDTLLRAATVDGHRSLGWPHAGRIAVGDLADLVTVDLHSVRTAGARQADALHAAVFAATAADVRHVMASGRVVVRDGAHVALDVASELRNAIGAVT